LIYLNQDDSFSVNFESNTFDNYGRDMTIDDVAKIWDFLNRTVFPYDCEDYDEELHKFYDIEMGSFFYLSSNFGTLTVVSKNNYYRGSQLTVRGGIFNVLPNE